MSRSTILFVAALLLIAAGALAFRLPRLGERPMHTDESVQVEKFRILWQEGTYTYDPYEYHGPILNYLTLPVAWITRPAGFEQTTEFTYRIVPVVFGVGLILLLALVRDALGRVETLCAAALTAISPAMVYYSRYYIHEMAMVLFLFLAIGAAWRYARSGHIAWALLFGAAIGLTHATKETWVMSAGAAAIALALAWLWARLVDREQLEIRWSLDWRMWILAVAAALAITIVLYTGFFQNWRGPLDSILTYQVYLGRGTGQGEHNYPWDAYVDMLTWFRYGRGPIFSEGLILALAAIGVGFALRRRPAVQTEAAELPEIEAQLALARSRRFFLRFLAFYTIALTTIYSSIPYKTPWCMLSFLHGMILLAGVGAVAIVRSAPLLPIGVATGAAGLLLWPDPKQRAWSVALAGGLATVLAMPKLAVRAIAGLILVAAAAQLGLQAYRASFTLAADRTNPYVYAMPGLKMFELVQRVRDIAEVSPEGRDMLVYMVTPPVDCWPLPWYLRDFRHAGALPDVQTWVSWVNANAARASAASRAVTQPAETDLLWRPAVVITTPEFQEAVESHLKDKYIFEFKGLRPGVPLAVYIREDLWQAFLRRRGIQ